MKLPQFTWFENWHRCEGPPPDCKALTYSVWLLADQDGRVLASIDGPTENLMTYSVDFEGGPTRRLYITLEKAKEYAEWQAHRILGEEVRKKAMERHSKKARRKVADPA